MTQTTYSNARLVGRAATQSIDQPAVSRLPFAVRLYLVMTVLPILLNVGSLTLSGQRVILLLLALPLAFNLVRGKYGRILWTDVFFFLHIAWATVAIAVNNPDRVIQNVGSAGIEFLGGYLVGRAYIRSADELVALARFLVFLVCCLLPLALFETVTGRPILMEMVGKIPGIESVEIVTIEARMGLERVQAVFAHPIHFGIFCCAVFSLAFVGLNGLISPARRYLFAAIIGLSVFLSLSSGALLPLLLQLFFVFWAYSLNRVRSRWLVLLGIFILIYITIALFSNRPPIKVFMSYATFSAHNAYWRGIIFEWGMINVWGSPIFGIGLKDWVRPFFMPSASIDNFWLAITVRYGIPGLALLVLGYFPALWSVARRNFDADHRIWLLRRAWVFTFAGLTLTLCTVHIWTSIYSFVFFLFGAGMWFLTIEKPVPSQKSTLDEQGPKGRMANVLKLKRSVSSDIRRPAVVEVRTSQTTTSYSRFSAKRE